MSKTNKKNLKYQIDTTNYCIQHLLKNKEFKLEAPTGSGKTFIISQIIDQYLENDTLNSGPTTFLFIAPSTGNLDYQGYEKITQYVKKDWGKGFSTQYIGTHGNKNSQASLQSIKFFEPNKVYFIGWQLLRSGCNITEINSEKNNIYSVIYNTKSNNTKIVLIIDEAHREVRTDKKNDSVKQEFLKQLDPFKIIKVSATLSQVQQTPDYKITYDDVREECAIKKNVQISSVNENVHDIEKYSENSQLILSALQKQKQIKDVYFKKNIDINPLILIQIPDEVVIDKEISNEKQLLNEIEELLQKNGLSKKNSYAIWLDKEKTNKKEEIINNDSTIEVLIFKQAIATGWDIPRANILVRIREAKTKAFNIQTLGRILRNPLFKYYDNELIDDAYVFTRDEKYKEYIKQEEIVSDINDKVKVDRSDKAKNSKFSINKIKLIPNSNYKYEQLLDYVSDEILNNEQFKSNFFKRTLNNFKLINTKISTKDVLEGNEENIENEIKKQKYENIQMNFSEPKTTLFQLFIKFKTITNSSQLINKILEIITNKLNHIGKTIKDFYNSCIDNWDRALFEFGEGEKLTLKELIIRYKDNYLKDKITHDYEVYQLPEQYEFIKSKINEEWDKINSFKISFKNDNEHKAFDSQNEKEFYKEIKFLHNIESNCHIFRNGTSEKYDYYVEYLDEDSKIRRFFPDFILINEENKTCFIFEAKGHNKNTDIDKMSKYKFDAVKKNIENKSINKNYSCIEIYKVSYVNNEIKYNNDIKFDDIIEKIKSLKNIN